MSHAIVNASLLHKTFLWPIASCWRGKFFSKAHRSLLIQILFTSPTFFTLNFMLHLHWTIFNFSSHILVVSRLSSSRKLLSPFPPHALPALLTNSDCLPPANLWPHLSDPLCSQITLYFAHQSTYHIVSQLPCDLFLPAGFLLYEGKDQKYLFIITFSASSTTPGTNQALMEYLSR